MFDKLKVFDISGALECEVYSDAEIIELSVHENGYEEPQMMLLDYEQAKELLDWLVANVDGIKAGN